MRVCGGCLLAGVAVLWAGGAEGWTVETRVALAGAAAEYAPPDLARQIERHEARFFEGVREGFGGASKGMSELVRREVEGAIGAIRGHRPFADIVRQMGVVAGRVAEANDPLLASEADAAEGRYADDFRRYVESARGRFAVAFYGDGRGVDSPEELAALLAATCARSAALYPLVGREYRRIGFRPGVEAFDDRSTAFGLAALGYSHAASDIIAVLRYIWIRAGGADSRAFLELSPPPPTPSERSPC